MAKPKNDDFESFQKELAEALKNFKTFSPQKQQFHLQRIANLATAQNDEFLKGILQKLFGLFQKLAERVEVQDA